MRLKTDDTKIARGDTQSENDHTFGPKFGFQNRTLTVQWIFMKNHTLTVHFFKISRPKGENFCNFPRKFGIFPQKLAHFVPKLPKNWPFYHDFLPLQCSSVKFCNFLPLQCTSWTMKNLPLRAERLVGHLPWVPPPPDPWYLSVPYFLTPFILGSKRQSSQT